MSLCLFWTNSYYWWCTFICIDWSSNNVFRQIINYRRGTHKIVSISLTILYIPKTKKMRPRPINRSCRVSPHHFPKSHASKKKTLHTRYHIHIIVNVFMSVICFIIILLIESIKGGYYGCSMAGEDRSIGLNRV